MTESQPARTNRKGHPCPPWCVTDHDEELVPGHFTESHGGDLVPVHGDAFLSVRPCLAPGWAGPPRVQVHSRGGSLFTEDVSALAALVEQLAGATPDQHRELAAAIRKAAADIAGGGNG